MKIHVRGLTSLVLTLASLAMIVSGVMLFFTPRGRVANWTGWTLLGLSKDQWQLVHMSIALLFVVAAGVHLALNWIVFWCYIKKRGAAGLNLKMEMLLALIVALVVVAGSIAAVPPFSNLMNLNAQIKDSWEQPAEQAPVPHAEELSLQRLAARMGLPADDVADALLQEGIVVDSTSQTLAEIAASNGTTPQAVHASIRQRFPDSRTDRPRGGGGGGGGGGGAGRGEGRGMGGGMGRGMGGGGGQ